MGRIWIPCRRVLVGAMLVVGCGPMVQLEDDSGSSGDDGTSTSTSTTGPGTTVPGTTAPPPGTTATPPPGDTTGFEDTGFIFIPRTDEGWGWGCDVFDQDCPPGEKCVPWANDGGSYWNATRCSPVVDDPDGVGEPCLVEGSGTSGIDTCDYGSMCWDVDPATLEGTCVAFCVGDESNPVCEDESATCIIPSDGVLALCLLDCDPLLQDCADGRACYPVNDTFLCSPDVSGDMGVPGDPCEYINVCDSGSFCAAAEFVPGCAGIGCCSAFCALDDPMPPCLPGQECMPWFEAGAAPPDYENVGGCVLP